MPYRLLDHTSDLGFEVWAVTKEELFVEAAKALYSEMLEDPRAVEARLKEEVVLEEESLEFLLREWLDYLIYKAEVDKVLFSEFEVKELADTKLVVEAKGERVSPKRHKFKRSPKSVTYHNLRVKEEPWGWVATVIIDI